MVAYETPPWSPFLSCFNELQPESNPGRRLSHLIYRALPAWGNFAPNGGLPYHKSANTIPAGVKAIAIAPEFPSSNHLPTTEETQTILTRLDHREFIATH